MRALVDELEPTEAVIIYARFHCNKKLAEISEDLDMPISTVHAHLGKALVKLQRKLMTYEGLLD